MAEANDLETKLKSEIKDQSPAKKITVQKLFDESIKMKSHEVRESALDKVEQILRRDVLPAFKDTRLNRLSVSVLQSWKNDIAARD